MATVLWKPNDSVTLTKEGRQFVSSKKATYGLSFFDISPAEGLVFEATLRFQGESTCEVGVVPSSLDTKGDCMPCRPGVCGVRWSKSPGPGRISNGAWIADSSIPNFLKTEVTLKVEWRGIDAQLTVTPKGGQGLQWIVPQDALPAVNAYFPVSVEIVRSLSYNIRTVEEVGGVEKLLTQAKLTRHVKGSIALLKQWGAVHINEILLDCNLLTEFEREFTQLEQRRFRAEVQKTVSSDCSLKDKGVEELLSSANLLKYLPVAMSCFLAMGAVDVDEVVSDDITFALFEQALGLTLLESKRLCKEREVRKAACSAEFLQKPVYSHHSKGEMLNSSSKQDVVAELRSSPDVYSDATTSGDEASSQV